MTVGFVDTKIVNYVSDLSEKVDTIAKISDSISQKKTEITKLMKEEFSFIDHDIYGSAEVSIDGWIYMREDLRYEIDDRRTSVRLFGNSIIFNSGTSRKEINPRRVTTEDVLLLALYQKHFGILDLLLTELKTKERELDNILGTMREIVESIRSII